MGDKFFCGKMTKMFIFPIVYREKDFDSTLLVYISFEISISRPNWGPYTALNGIVDKYMTSSVDMLGCACPEGKVEEE